MSWSMFTLGYKFRSCTWIITQATVHPYSLHFDSHLLWVKGGFLNLKLEVRILNMVSKSRKNHTPNILAFFLMLYRGEKGTRTGALKISILSSCYGHKKVKYKSQSCILKGSTNSPWWWASILPYPDPIYNFPFGDLWIPVRMSFSRWCTTNRCFLLLFINKTKVV